MSNMVFKAYALASEIELTDQYAVVPDFEIIESKINDLKNIVSSYYSLSYNSNERRLLLFEIFLLALFPASHLLGLLFNQMGPVQVINSFLGKI